MIHHSEFDEDEFEGEEIDELLSEEDEETYDPEEDEYANNPEEDPDFFCIDNEDERYDDDDDFE
jgi:hypothetical protein